MLRNDNWNFVQKAILCNQIPQVNHYMDFKENIHQSTTQKITSILILSYQGRQYIQLRVLNSTCYKQDANMSYKKYAVSAVLSQIDRKINFCLLTGNQAIKPIMGGKGFSTVCKTLRQIQHSKQTIKQIATLIRVAYLYSTNIYI